MDYKNRNAGSLSALQSFLIYKTKLISLLFIFLFSSNCAQENKTVPTVLTGADILVSENLDLLKGKNLGIITNQTGVMQNGKHLVDSLLNIPGIKIKTLFGPEHGIRGNSADGKIISDTTDESGVRIFSIYGSTKKPTPEMLKDIDLLIFDMQDVGARFYTFISTMFYCLEAAAENNIPILILDRPNPIGGLNVDGPIIEKELESFVGIAPIPIMHGMTIGELALLFNDEQMLKDGMKADLKIIKMKNWKREYFYDETGLNWIPPSPNIPNLETAIVYPGTCLLEGTNISEGRGTDSPFLLFGTPFFDSKKIINELEKMNILGAEFSEEEFIPVEIPGKAVKPKFENQKCYGIRIKVTDRNEFKSVEFGVKLLSIISKIHSNEFQMKKYLDQLFGKKYLREMIIKNSSYEIITSQWVNELNQFKQLRNKYLQY